MTGLAGNPRAAGQVSVVVGGGQMNYVAPYAPELAGTTLTLTAQRVYLRKVRVDRPITITKFRVPTVAAGGNVDVAVFDAAGTTRIAASAGAVASAGANGTDVPLAASFTYQPGIEYYHAVLVDNVAVTVKGPATTTGAVTSVDNVTMIKDVAQNTIPATLTAPTAGSGTNPLIIGLP